MSNEQLSSKTRVSDTELRLLIQALEANGKARSISQNDTLLALYELSNRRAADDMRLGLKEYSHG